MTTHSNAPAEPESPSTGSGVRSGSNPPHADLPEDARLPTIIVDPSLSQPPVAASAAEASAENSELPTHAFDAAAADRFAEAYRPSWEPPPGAAVPRRSSVPPQVTGARASSVPPQALAAPVVDDVAPLNVKRQKQRAIMWTGASVVGFLLLAYWAIALTTHSSPNHDRSAAAPATKESAKSQPAQAASAPPVVQEPKAPAVADTVTAEANPALAEAQPAAAEPAAAAPTPSETSTGSAPANAASNPAALAVAAEPAAPAEPEPKEPTTLPTLHHPANQPVVDPNATHRLRIATDPASASLIVDGAAAKNPSDLRLPQGSDHRIEASAPGFETTVRTLHLVRDERISLVLARKKRAPSAQPAAKPAARTTKEARPARRRAPKGAAFVADSPY